MFRRTAWIGLVVLAACGSEPSSSTDHDLAPQAQLPVPPPAVVLFDSPPPPRPVTDPPMQADPPVPAEIVIPLDEREAVQAASPPPAISGGTLLVTRDSRFAVAADPDRDRVSIVDLANGPLLAVTLTLEPGDEPGRLVEDDAGRVHVALRRGGAVVSIDVPTATVVARRNVCPAARGIAFDSSTGSLLIACADGELMSLPANPSGAASMRARLQTDLRDVMVAGDRTFVSRFKRAELLALDADGAVAATHTPQQVTAVFLASLAADVIDQLAPTFAFRTLQGGDGSMFMLHQGSRVGEINVDVEPTVSNGIVNGTGPYGGGGGFGTCGGVVQSELTVFGANGSLVKNGRLPGVLPVDAALDAGETQIAVVFAGTTEPGTPVRSIVAPTRTPTTPSAGSAGSFAGPPPAKPAVNQAFGVAVFSLNDLVPDSTAPCQGPIDSVPSTAAAEPVAVAYSRYGWVVQNREPAQLILFQNGWSKRTDLGGDSVADTGHSLFHHDAGGGIACASCHAEGGEDGHVWHFSGSGPRRTQALHVGLEGTAPFHWAGDMTGMPELMEEVLVTRMGGVHQSPARATALEHWLFSLRPPAPLRTADDPAVTRGRALFQGSAACAGCHSGDKLTSNHNEDVGTGEALQVPSLVGVGYRGPWIHDGCANTLRERFDVACGGSKHGNTADLDAAQIDDLVAYLESL